MIGKKGSKSNAVASADGNDFAVLDNAVSELSKQTEALLGKTGEKMSRPKLPKKSVHHHKAKSFDIIHDPAKKVRTKSVLKSTQPSQRLIEPSEEKLIEAVPTPEKPVESITSVVSSHSSGSLQLNQDEADTSEVTTPQSEGADTKELEAVQNAESVVQPVSQVGNSVKPDNTDQSTDDKGADTASTSSIADSAEDTSDNNIDLHEDDTSNTGLVDELDTDKTDTNITSEPVKESKNDQTAAESESKSTELYSDNLKSDPITFDEDATEPKVAVFDTEEYHSTLHDWSKLEHHNKAPIVLLLVLTIILAVGVYIIVSGTSVTIPF